MRDSRLCRRTASLLVSVALPASAPVVAFADAPIPPADSTAPLYPALGPAGGTAFLVDPAVPPGHDGARWISVVQRSLARWGDSFAGFTSAGVDPSDGLDVIAFSSELGGGPDVVEQVGAQYRRHDFTIMTPVPARPDCAQVPVTVTSAVPTLQIVRVRRRVPLRVHGRVVRRDGKVVYDTLRRHGRTVRRNGRPVFRHRWIRMARIGSHVVAGIVLRLQCTTLPAATGLRKVSDRDIAVNPNPRWQFGPAHPDARQIDLETTILHELGHASGLGHTPEPCTLASPMGPATVAGDWWRSPEDASDTDCLAAFGPAAGTPAAGVLAG
jgi:hypothetical protein